MLADAFVGVTGQPLTARGSNPWIARLIIVAVGVVLIFGSLAFFTGVQ